MSIVVTCTKCKKVFKVSEKFAGQTGPCPNCKAKIRVPTKEEEIKVHAAVVTAGEKSVRPLLRAKPKTLEPVIIVAICGISLGVVLVTWVAGPILKNNLLLLTVGLLAISPPLVVAAYSFLRDDELEAYQGKLLWLRSGICGAAYVILWGVYTYVAGIVLHGELWEWMFVVPPLLAVGATVPLVCLDLDYGAGFFHYAFYLVVTVLLRWIAGMGWIWVIPQTPVA